MTDTDEIPRERRVSRYQKAQERRARQKAADNRFYGAMFGLMGVVVMFSLLVAALAMNGANIDASGTEGWTTPWLGPLSKVEFFGLIVIAVIAALMYRRLRKR